MPECLEKTGSSIVSWTYDKFIIVPIEAGGARKVMSRLGDRASMNLGNPGPGEFLGSFTTASLNTCATQNTPIALLSNIHIIPSREKRVRIANMRLTTDLINNSLSFINCLAERELDLRGA